MPRRRVFMIVRTTIYSGELEAITEGVSEMGKGVAIVVGTGFGCRIHVPALRAAGIEVAALVATRPDRLARKAAELSIPQYFTDLDEAIAKTGATLVTIATTP